MKLNQAKLHFVGIGGVGMSGIAQLFRAMGAQVSGSDMAESLVTQELRSLGISVYIGHSCENIKEADVVVYSSAVNMANPELVEARQKKIPLIPRAEALSELMRLKRGIAIAGSHGKTTTTSMVSHIFLQCQMSPTVVIGGKLRSLNSGAHFGEGEWLIAEADESDGSFSRLSPEMAVITNIDSDHLDFFKSFDHLVSAFYQFGLRIPFYGSLLACGDDKHLVKAFEHFTKKIFFYGFENHNYFQIKKTKVSQVYVLEQKGHGVLGEFFVPMAGSHNVLNAAASLLLAMRAGVSFEEGARALKTFGGVERRLHHLGHLQGREVYTDYAHHPTELLASIQAFREMFPDRKLVGVFQPHRYSRTELCWNEFLTCFRGLDKTVITEIYAAGEKPIDQISSENLVKAIGSSAVGYVHRSELSSYLSQNLPEQSVLIFFGAGDIYKMGKELLSVLSAGALRG